MKYTLKAQIMQKCQHIIENENEKCQYYKDFERSTSIQKYFNILPKNLWIPFCKFRTSNHRLPVEFNSWDNFFKPRSDRLCAICSLNDIGDEYHYVMICPAFKELREIYIPKYYKNRPSVHKFIQIMSSDKRKVLFKLAIFIREILNLFQ